METVISNVRLTVYKDGVIKNKNDTIDAILDVDGLLKVCINNCYYKVHDIVAMVYLDYDLSDKYRFVSHIDNNPKNNSINNLKIENMELKRKLNNLS